MIQFIIAILLGLAADSENTTVNENTTIENNSEYTTMNGDGFDETGGENGQVPPPPKP